MVMIPDGAAHAAQMRNSRTAAFSLKARAERERRGPEPEPYWMYALFQLVALWTAYAFWASGRLNLIVLFATMPFTLHSFMAATVGAPVLTGRVRSTDFGTRIGLALGALATVGYFVAVPMTSGNQGIALLAASTLSTVAAILVIAFQRFSTFRSAP